MNEYYYDYEIYSLAKYEESINEKMINPEGIVGGSKIVNPLIKLNLFHDYKKQGKLCLQLMMDLNKFPLIRNMRNSEESLSDPTLVKTIYFFYKHYANNVDYITKVDLDNVNVIEVNKQIINSGGFKVEIGNFFSYIMDLEEKIEGCGIFGFTTDMNNISKATTFIYSTILTKRERISYIINKVSKEKMEVSVEHPILSKDIVLEVRKSKNLPLAKEFSEIEHKIVLKAHTFSTPNIIINVPKDMEYRLFFEDDELNKLYILDDQSYVDFNGINNEGTNKRTKDYFLKDIPRYKKPYESKKCVYCFKKESEAYTIGKDKCCKVKYEIGTKTETKDIVLTKKKKKFTIGLHGQTSCGKSVYLGSLLFVQPGGLVDVSYLNTTISPYINDKPIEFIYPYIKGTPASGEIVGRRVTNIRVDVPYENYIVCKGYNLPGATDSSKDRIETKIPHCLRINKNKEIYIYDVAGGNSSKNLHGTASSCDCLLLLVDYESERSINNSIVILDTYLEKMKDLNKSKEKSLNETVIAVVVTKFDKILAKHKEFDDNCFVRRTESYKEKKHTKYSDSLMQNCINQSSREIESFLSRCGHNNLIDKLSKNFVNYKFFATSSITDNDSIYCDLEKDINCLVYEASPTRIEQPLLWIMYKMGYIR